MDPIDLAYDGPVWILSILSTTDPDMAAGVEMFNFFFGMMMLFTIIGTIIKMIVRVLTRS